MSPQPSAQGTASRIFSGGGISAISPGAVLIIAALPLVLYLLNRIVFPSVDAREPPVLRPKIPFFGHIISLFREQTNMFDRLYKEKSMPICTLPMLHGQVYVINSPSLIAAAMRNRNLSFDPFSLEFAESAMGMTRQHVEIFSREGVMDEVNNVIHASLTGDNVYQMNRRALADVADVLNDIKPESSLDVPDVFEWLRNLMSLATMTALYGKNNPMGKEGIEQIWEFEKGVGLLAVGLAQNVLAPKALAARRRAAALLRPFYVAHLDQGDDVSAIIKNRAAIERRLGVPDEEICVIEFSMPWVGTTNTIPTLFWFFVHVFAEPRFVESIREEVLAVTAVAEKEGGRGGRVATIDISRLEKGCRTLHACYRESLRLYSDMFGNRRVVADTVLRDPADGGREYLLRKGVNVQWASVVAHFLDAVWGADAREFRPERFVDVTPAEEKRRRGAMIPFGGGRNLCPGRNFALAENLGMVSAVALGFEVEGTGVPRATDAYLGTAMRRPDWEGKDPGVRIRRREGWEDVEWRFAC